MGFQYKDILDMPESEAYEYIEIYNELQKPETDKPEDSKTITYVVKQDKE